MHLRNEKPSSQTEASEKVVLSTTECVNSLHIFFLFQDDGRVGQQKFSIFIRIWGWFIARHFSYLVWNVTPWTNTYASGPSMVKLEELELLALQPRIWMWRIRSHATSTKKSRKRSKWNKSRNISTNINMMMNDDLLLLLRKRKSKRK